MLTCGPIKNPQDFAFAFVPDDADAQGAVQLVAEGRSYLNITQSLGADAHQGASAAEIFMKIGMAQDRINDGTGERRPNRGCGLDVAVG